MGRTLPWTGLVLLVPCFLLHRDDFGARTFTEPRASASGFSCGYAPLYYKILISSRAATISWWDKRFACHRRAVAGVWLRPCSFVGQLFKLRTRFHRVPPAARPASEQDIQPRTNNLWREFLIQDTSSGVKHNALVVSSIPDQQ